MNRFIEQSSGIEGVYYISKQTISDNRGYLERLFCLNELKCWSNRSVAQVNKTFIAKKGTIKGFHFQRPPKAEAKFICCLKGKVTDFALDLRQASKTFGKIAKFDLDAKLHNAVMLPEGVAHGFQSLTDNVEMLYFHSEFYAPGLEMGVNILDPSLNLQFELPSMLISKRDKQFPPLSEIQGLAT